MGFMFELFCWIKDRCCLNVYTEKNDSYLKKENCLL